MARSKVRFQVRMADRRWTGTGASPQLDAAIDREAKRWGVSRSFVIHNAVGYALGVDVESYRPKLRRVK